MQNVATEPEKIDPPEDQNKTKEEILRRTRLNRMRKQLDTARNTSEK